MHQFLKFILGMKLYMFRTVPLSIIRSFSLYTHQWCMSYRRAGSEWYILILLSKSVWHIPLLCVQWKTPDDGQMNCPKHVEFNSKNKFEKLVHLVGFIIRNLARCTVIWASNLTELPRVIVIRKSPIDPSGCCELHLSGTVSNKSRRNERPIRFGQCLLPLGSEWFAFRCNNLHIKTITRDIWGSRSRCSWGFKSSGMLHHFTGASWSAGPWGWGLRCCSRRR